MASLEEELALAKQAKAAIEGELTREAVEVLRKAYLMAAMQPAVSGPLRDARLHVGVAASSCDRGPTKPRRHRRRQISNRTLDRGNRS